MNDCIPRVTDISRWRKRSWDIETHLNWHKCFTLLEKNIWSSHIRIDILRCAYTRLIYFQSCYMDVKHGPSLRHNSKTPWCFRHLVRAEDLKACPHWRLVADFGAENSDCRRKRRLSQKSATVAELRLSPLSRRFRRQSHFSATVWTGLYTTNDRVRSITACHQCRVGSSHSGWVSLDTLLVPIPRRTITVSLPPHLDHLLIGGSL